MATSIDNMIDAEMLRILEKNREFSPEQTYWYLRGMLYTRDFVKELYDPK